MSELLRFDFDAYERDLAQQAGSGIHTFTLEHRSKNRAVMSALQASMPFQDVNKTNDCDLIYRYLIARKWDVEAATQSIRDYLEWRRRERIDEVMWESFEAQVEETVATFFGLDNEGHPIMWDAPNSKLMSNILKSASSRDAMLRAHYKMMESARYLSRTNGVDRITYVLDLTAVTMSSANTELIGILKEMSKTDQLYFPEIMRRMLICNGGWAVSAIWRVMCPILDERVQKKIQFLKTPPSPATLSEYIADSHVHPKYGGRGQGHSGNSGMSLMDQLNEASLRRAAVRGRDVQRPASDEDGFYSLSDDDDGAEQTTDTGIITIASDAVVAAVQCNAGSSAQPMSRSEADRRSESASDLSATSTVCGMLPMHHEACPPYTPTKATPYPHVLTPGQRGDGIAVDLQIHRHGKVVRGFHESHLVGEGHDNLIMSFAAPAASVAGGPCRVLIGELLRESGHPIHTHLVVSDANRNAKFVLMQRNFHKQIVIYQVVGDTKIHTSKMCKHSVLGEKAKMARCGERVEGCDARDWAVWGKVRVGNQEVRKYLAEKQGQTLLFYDTLASLPIQDLFCLAVGLMELWEA